MKLNQRQRAQQWLRKLKRVLEWAAALAFDQLAFVGVQSRAVTPNRATLVHVELIGDYFLWLPFALLLNRHLQKQGVEVSIVCNRDLTELVSTNFPECNVFGVERKRFRSDWRYRLKQLRKIRQMGQPEVFCLTCPRDLLVTDSIIRALGGRATGFAATALDRPAIDTLCSDRNYSKLVTAQPSVHQSTLYLTFLREIGCPTVEPVNGVAFRQRGDHGRYFVVSPGASDARKVWPAHRFLEIAAKVLDRDPEMKCILIGAPSEQAFIEALRTSLGDRAMSLAGQLTLVQLTEVIGRAAFVLGNDSAAGHIAAFCSVPSIIITSGAEYGRCYPYDQEASPVRALPRVVSYPMDCFGCNWNCRFQVDKGEALPCVQNVDIDSVWAEVEQLLERGLTD